MAAENPPSTPMPLREARYSLKDMLREVEHERRNSVLGMELMDQNEIGSIFKSRARKKPAKKK